jgi:hypothetical protein
VDRWTSSVVHNATTSQNGNRMKASLKSLAAGGSAAGQTTPAEPSPPPAPEQTHRTYRMAQTRAETRQVSGHFRPDVAQTLRLIAAEQGPGHSGDLGRSLEHGVCPLWQGHTR